MVQYRRIHQQDNSSPIYWHLITSEGVFLECLARRHWRERSLLIGLLNYPQGEVLHDTMDRLPRVHAFDTEGIILFLDAGKMVWDERESDHLSIVFHHLVEDYRFTAETRFRPLAICLGWREGSEEPSAPPQAFVERYHALQQGSTTLAGIDHGHRLCLENASGLRAVLSHWETIGRARDKNPFKIFPMMLHTKAEAARISGCRYTPERLFDPVAWMLHTHRHLRLPAK